MRRIRQSPARRKPNTSIERTGITRTGAEIELFCRESHKPVVDGLQLNPSNAGAEASVSVKEQVS